MRISDSAEKASNRSSNSSPPKVVVIPKDEEMVKVDVCDSNDEMSHVEISQTMLKEDGDSEPEDGAAEYVQMLAEQQQT